MILRIWTVGIAQGKNKELEIFANEVSAPMFKTTNGCMGGMFLQSANECKTITIWDSAESVSALNDSLEYQQVVEDIENSGILCGEHHTEVYEPYGGFMTQQFTDELPNLRIYG